MLSKHNLAGPTRTKLLHQPVLIELVREALPLLKNQIHGILLALLALKVKYSCVILIDVKLQRIVLRHHFTNTLNFRWHIQTSFFALCD